MTDREIFRNNLYNLMKVTKVRQIDVARATDVSYQTVSAWITGRGYPRADAMQRLCTFFGVKLSALTEDQNAVSDEDKLLLAYRMLSAIGQDKLMERAEELKILYPKRSKRNAETETES